MNPQEVVLRGASGDGVEWNGVECGGLVMEWRWSGGGGGGTND